ncbi:hypothetical protein GCM10009759_62090 [Kitasatospora saccharophila]|uniref:Uncharacterized protein n=1 Tax=Kitasatospora saccharophila TaxID=407973 RepID=A0ABN2XUN5_9ACTN
MALLARPKPAEFIHRLRSLRSGQRGGLAEPFGPEGRTKRRTPRIRGPTGRHLKQLCREADPFDSQMDGASQCTHADAPPETLKYRATRQNVSPADILV